MTLDIMTTRAGTSISYRRSPPNPHSITPKRPSPLIHILILIRRPQRELIRVEVHPPIQDRHRIRMLYHRVPHQRLNHIVIRGNQSRAAGRIAINSHVLLRLESVDIVDGILLAGRNVHAAAVVGCEAGLLGGDLAWVLDCGEDL
jgi:hypothetical protein